MKKITLILLMFMSICSVYGQAGLSLSIKGGAGISNFFNLKFFQEKDIMVLPAIGYSLGAEMGWNAEFFNFGITGGAYIRQYGHSMDNLGSGQLPEIHNYYKLLDHQQEQQFKRLLKQIIALVPNIDGSGISGFMKLPYKDTRFFEHQSKAPTRYYQHAYLPQDP